MYNYKSGKVLFVHSEIATYVPYLLKVLLRSDRSQISQTSIFLRWLEKELGTPFLMAKVS